MESTKSRPRCRELFEKKLMTAPNLCPRDAQKRRVKWFEDDVLTEVTRGHIYLIYQMMRSSQRPLGNT